MKNKKYDFCGWATKFDIRCGDGRIIRDSAFRECDGKTVPLVWNHSHSDPQNVLGHALLEYRPGEGMYTYGYFNDTYNGQNAKSMVDHGDIKSLSIYANQLKQNSHDVVHGVIREVSLVLAGCNPGATIEDWLTHSDGSSDEAVIYSGDDTLSFEHSCSSDKKNEDKEEKEDKKEPVIEHSKDNSTEEKSMDNKEQTNVPAKQGKTIEEVFDTLTDEQKDAVYAVIGMAIQDKKHNEKEENEDMKHNVFENDVNDNYLSHSDMEAIFNDAKRYGSLKDSVLAHGIDDIEYLFPDDKALNKAPDFIKRNDAWVSSVMNSVHHTPFSRTKSMYASITEADARAKGYIKGHKKVEEVFGLLKRTTSPTTIYKKQKLDRDDIIDITDFDVVSWLKTEMRMMLDEEIARAILVGDGRNSASDDKIDENCIRPIWTDDELFTINKTIQVAANATDDQKAKAFIRACVKSRKEYKGSGNPVLYTTEDVLTDCLLMEDNQGRIIYDTVDKLATALRVRSIITVPVMENLTRVIGANTRHLMGIIVNLDDYNVGADKGGSVSMFDDFDIDYNQQKYLIETRCSGSLIKPYSAIAIEMVYGNSFTVEPEDPSTNMLGKLASALQSDVLVNDSFIQGTLKYVTGYTGYSGDADLQRGNFLALKFTAPDDAVTKVELLGGHSGPVTLDSDMNAVVRIENKNTQKIKVVSTLDGVEVSKVYSLTSLRVESAS